MSEWKETRNSHRLREWLAYAEWRSRRSCLLAWQLEGSRHD